MKTNRTVVGVDTAKRVFQMHWVDMETDEIVDVGSAALKHRAGCKPL